MTARQKIFAFIGLLVLVNGALHALTNQLFMDYWFDQFRNNEINGSYMNAAPGEQIEILKVYILDKLRLIGAGKGIFFGVTGLIISPLIAAVLIRPLRQLVAAIERVSHGNLDVKVPVHAKDEYGKVIQSFNDMTLRLREAEDARSRLVADVAHELRTPLSIMQLKLENAQHTGQHVPPEMLLHLHDEVIRLSLLVEDLHVLSLAEAGRLSLDLKPIDLSAHIERIVEDVKYEAEDNRVDIQLQTNAGPVMVEADSRRITQVFINLLTNAIRYTPGGGEISIRIEDPIIDLGETYACVSVKDTGIGIPAEDLAHLFDRFYRVEEARTRNSGGSGLGLSIAHQFVKAHGGFIRVQSEQDLGTSFTVYLPSQMKSA